MRDAAFAEERAFALMGAVDELIDQHECAGRQLFLERAAGRQRDQIGDAGALEHVDIGAIIDVGRRIAVALTVPRQKHHRQARDFADAQRSGRLAPWALDVLRTDLFQARQIVNARAANNAKHRFGHEITNSARSGRQMRIYCRPICRASPVKFGTASLQHVIDRCALAAVEIGLELRRSSRAPPRSRGRPAWPRRRRRCRYPNCPRRGRTGSR